VAHGEGELLTVGPVDRTWLARTAAAYAPDAVVLDPPDLVDDIVARLERAHDLLGGAR
jgi:proteasome accessory factor C